MANSRIAAVVLAAGMGTRMKSALPKVMHAIAGRPMIGHVLANLAPLAPRPWSSWWRRAWKRGRGGGAPRDGDPG